VIPLKEQEVLKQRFARELQNRVRIDFFGQKPSGVFIPGRADNSAVCEDVRKLLHEIAALNLRLSLTAHDIDADAETAEALGVEGAPAIVLRGPANRPVRYFGNPRLKQFATFVEALLLVAHGKPALQPDTLRTLRKLRSDVALTVFVTPVCAHSPVAVITALRLALENAHVRLDVVDVTTFPDAIGRYFVRATPQTMFGGQYAIPGVIEEGNLAEDILAAAQGGQPSRGGDPKRLTPLAAPRPRQQQQQGPRSTSSGLIIPR
jgi:alkyl hydroperoxide reductase subunit AhpF